MIPMYFDIFILTAAICFDQVSFSSMITPRKRASVTRVIQYSCACNAWHTSIFEYSIFCGLMSCSEFFRFSDRTFLSTQLISREVIIWIFWNWLSESKKRNHFVKLRGSSEASETQTCNNVDCPGYNIMVISPKLYSRWDVLERCFLNSFTVRIYNLHCANIVNECWLRIWKTSTKILVLDETILRKPRVDGRAPWFKLLIRVRYRLLGSVLAYLI